LYLKDTKDEIKSPKFKSSPKLKKIAFNKKSNDFDLTMFSEQ